MGGVWRWSLVVAVAMQALVPEVAAAKGVWKVVTKNAGIASMHSAVTPLVGSVVMLDHSNTGPSNITFPGGRCRETTYDTVLQKDCWAHSVILDPTTGAVRPLMILTDTQCSSGQFLADGTLGQTGGDREGKKFTRTLSSTCYEVDLPINKTCDWVEKTTPALKHERWYSTNQLLPNGRQFIIGGRGFHHTYEFAPTKGNQAAFFMDFLKQTSDGPDKTKNGPNNLYPFVHLLRNGLLYIFANRDSITFDYKKNIVVRTFPKIPGNPRNYPSGGSSVMLALTWQGSWKKSEVLVCGGAMTTSGSQMPCSVTCGRIEVTKAGSNWAVENMPIPRCMGDMVLLPDTNVLIINGAEKGWQAWKAASEPALNPVLYEPAKNSGERFTVMDATDTPRMYHSTANLLTDAKVMVAGSNTHQYYTFNRGKINPALYFPTELSVETFTPPYSEDVAGGRPVIMSANATSIKYGKILEVVFWDYPSTSETFLFTLSSSPWTTHSYSHGQRVVTLQSLDPISTQPGTQNGVAVNVRTVNLKIPKYNTVLPPAYYMLWVVKNGNPSNACMWIQIKRSSAA